MSLYASVLFFDEHCLWKTEKSPGSLQFKCLRNAQSPNPSINSLLQLQKKHDWTRIPSLDCSSPKQGCNFKRERVRVLQNCRIKSRIPSTLSPKQKTWNSCKVAKSAALLHPHPSHSPSHPTAQGLVNVKLQLTTRLKPFWPMQT